MADFISKTTYLSQSEMEHNAKLIIEYFQKLNYNNKTIAGLLGNMQAESTINPRTF